MVGPVLKSEVNATGSIERPLDVAIVGAGISGIGMAAQLVRRCPGKRYVILERRARPGGTWDLFRYPGVRSDSDMYTLGYSFAPWRHDRSIAGGDDILAYLDEVIDAHGLRGQMRFGQTVAAADWDSRTGFWTLRIIDEAGVTNTVAARFLFLGSGYYDYDQPHDPEIPGLETFGGLAVHPQFWPQELDYTGKKIVVVGSGATAATLVPALAEQAAQVTMLQRTPSWYITRPARDGVASWLRRLLPAHLAYSLARAKNVRMQYFLFKKSRSEPEGMKAFLHKQLEGQLGSAFDRAQFTPPYGPWEQRMCLIPDGDLFAAIRSGKAQIVTGQIDRVEPSGIALTDGRRLDADVIVTATGLRIRLFGGIALGLDGKPLNASDRFHYRSCMLSGVPNFAALFGYLNASWTLRVDLVAEWLCRLFHYMDAQGFDVAIPHLPSGGELEEGHSFDAFSSGYLRRARHLVPRNATAAPWRMGMDYLADRKEMRRAPIEDGVLRFERMREAVTTHATSAAV